MAAIDSMSPRSIRRAFDAEPFGSGRLRHGTVRFLPGRSRVALPLGRIPAHKIYLYGDVEAVITLNGHAMPMALNPDGFWEFIAHASIKSVTLSVEAGPGRARWVLVEQVA